MRRGAVRVGPGELVRRGDALGDLVHGSHEPAVLTLGDQRSGVGVATSNCEEPRDPVDDVRPRLADEARRHHGEAERRRVAAGLGARAVERGLALPQLVVGGAERVHLGRVARRERKAPPHGSPAEDERGMRLLHRPRECQLIAETVGGPVVVEALPGPRANDDLDLLGEQREPLPRVEEREAVGLVLALVPARAHADVDAPARDVVDGRRHAGEHARMAEGRRRDERAEADAASAPGAEAPAGREAGMWLRHGRSVPRSTSA